MRDEAHVGLVDAHAERDRRDDDHALFAQETLLVALAHLRIEAGVIRQRHAALAAEPRRGLLDPACATGNRRCRHRRDARHRESPKAACAHRSSDDAVADVRAIEAGDEDARLVETQPLDDVGACRPVRGRGQRDTRHIGKALVQHRELEIFRPEIMSPLRHAMRLVDGEQRGGAISPADRDSAA